MLFSKDKSSDTSKRKESALGYLLNPEIGREISTLKDSWQLFVQTIASLFASAKLFPVDHPFLAKNSQVSMSLKQVISIAFKSLQLSPPNVPQIALFVAITGSLFFAALIIFFFVLSLFMGTAHAAATCDNKALFEPCSNEDLSIQWLDYLFSGKPISTYTGMQSTYMQDALRAFFSMYSGAILVIAGIMLMYHLLAMVAETAHTGKPMGRANQIWAPIRLVVAIALLVPASSGLNLGQSIMIQVAKWGCGLASQTWYIFLDKLGGATQNLLPPTGTPLVEKAVHDIILMKACMTDYNVIMSTMAYEGTTVPNKFVMKAQSSTDGGLQFTSAADGAVCGLYTFPTPPKASVNGFDAAAVSALYDIAKSSFNSQLGAMDTVAKNITFYHGDTTATSVKVADMRSISSILAEDIKTKMASINTASANNQINAVAEKGVKDGWLAAGAWFTTVTRVQGAVLDASMDALPRTTPPDLVNITKIAGNYENSSWRARNLRVSTTYDMLKEDLDNFDSDLGAHTTGNPRDLAASESGQAKDGYGIGAFFSIIDWLGRTIGVWPSNGDMLFEFTSSNPLNELVRMGHNNLQLGLYLVGAASISSAVAVVGGLFAGGAISGAVTAGAAAPVGAVIGAGAAMVVQQFSGLAIAIGTTIALSGAMLTFVLPLIPFYRFFFSIMNWLIVVFEAVVSMPLFALAHLNPHGDGLPGQRAERGYFFMLSILLRPTLMVVGLIAGFLLFFTAVTFLNKIFMIAAASTGATTAFSSLSKIVYSLIYVFLVYICANTCFKAIGHFPEHAMNWLGASGPQTKDLGDPSTLSSLTGATMAYLGGKGIGQLANAPGKMAEGVFGSAAKKLGEKGPTKDMKAAQGSLVSRMVGDNQPQIDQARSESSTPQEFLERVRGIGTEAYAKEAPTAPELAKYKKMDRAGIIEDFADQVLAGGGPTGQGAAQQTPQVAQATTSPNQNYRALHSLGAQNPAGNASSGLPPRNRTT